MVGLHPKVTKALRRLPGFVKDALVALIKDIEVSGPVRGDWLNYGKLGNGRHHCHLKKGRPTYVACWRETGPKDVEVDYVGTHEGAPY